MNYIDFRYNIYEYDDNEQEKNPFIKRALQLLEDAEKEEANSLAAECINEVEYTDQHDINIPTEIIHETPKKDKKKLTKVSSNVR